MHFIVSYVKCTRVAQSWYFLKRGQTLRSMGVFLIKFIELLLSEIHVTFLGAEGKCICS